MLVDRPATATDAIEAMLADPRLQPLIAAHRVLEPKPPRYAPWPEGLDPRLVNALHSRGVEALYTHQAQAVEAIAPGRNASWSRRPRQARRSATTCRSSTPSRRPDGARALPLPHQGAGARTSSRSCTRWSTRRARASRPTPTTATRPPNARERDPRAPGTSSSPTRTCSTPASCPTTPSGSSCSRTCATSSIDELHHYRGVFGSPRRQRAPPAAAHLPLLRLRPVSSAARPPSPIPASWPSALIEAPVDADRRQRRPARPQESRHLQPARRQPRARHPRARRC